MSTDKNKILTTDSSHKLKDVLSQLMIECDVDDAELARETSIPASTISRMRLNSDSNPTAATLRPIAKYFSVSVSQLLGDEPLPQDRFPGIHNPSEFTAHVMPVIDWEGIIDWVDNDGANIKSKLTKWISTEKEVCPRAFALPIVTDSFGLVFRKGSLIIIDPDRQPQDSDLALLQIVTDTSIVLKQFIKDGNDIYLKSVNPEIKGIKLLTADYKFLGVVIETRFSLQENKKALRFSLGSHLIFSKLDTIKV